MSKESSIKVICWSLKYARTCFSARLRDPHALPEAEQMKASGGGNGGAGHHVSVACWHQLRMGKSAANLEAASWVIWKPGAFDLAWPGMQRALLF